MLLAIYYICWHNQLVPIVRAQNDQSKFIWTYTKQVNPLLGFMMNEDPLF